MIRNIGKREGNEKNRDRDGLPSYSLIASARASMDSMSRLFVGSSRMITSGALNKRYGCMFDEFYFLHGSITIITTRIKTYKSK